MNKVTKRFSTEQLIDLLLDLNPVLDKDERNLTIDCPSCGQRECGISLNEGHPWNCYRKNKCGEVGNIWKILKLVGKLGEFVKKSSNTEFIDLKDLFTQGIDLGVNFVNKIDETLFQTPNIKLPMSWKRVFNDPYLIERNFKSYNECFVGRAPMHFVLRDYIVFLVKENNETKGYVARHTWSKDKISKHNKGKPFEKQIRRYYNAPGVDFGKLLYGYDEIDESIKKPVVLVEGIFDKHAIDEKLGLNKDRFLYTCATFKAAVSDEQIMKLLLKNITEVILFYDPDVINSIKKNIQKLDKWFDVKVIVPPFNKDPDEMTQEELLKVFDNHMYNTTVVFNDFIQVPTFKNQVLNK